MIGKNYTKLIAYTRWLVNYCKIKNSDKIFCVGLNKTGTTSLTAEMRNLGYIIGDQRSFEFLFDDWLNNDYNKIIKLCKTAQFFQDIPFSLPNTYKILDQEFSNSKFILTIRDSSSQWYTSLTRFHTKLWSKNGKLPNADDLKNANYIFKGFPYLYQKSVFGVRDNDLYNVRRLKEFYNSYNDDIIHYFSNNAEKLLVINLKEKNSYIKFCDFIKINPKKDKFIWKNKT